MKWLAVIRDTVIIKFLTTVPGILVVFFDIPESPRRSLVLILGNNLLGIGGFALIAVWAGQVRWRHIGVVATLVCLVNLNSCVFGRPLMYWLGGVFAIVIMMGLGGALSYVFTSSTRAVRGPTSECNTSNTT